MAPDARSASWLLAFEWQNSAMQMPWSNSPSYLLLFSIDLNNRHPSDD
jgi:arginine/lysine/ornithine decarboxylase